jgi:Crinkler effector protein N-terminal domain
MSASCLTLNCFVLDDDVKLNVFNEMFAVHIDSTENVMALKEAIKAKKVRFKDVDADALRLWKKSYSTDPKLKKQTFGPITLRDQDILFPTDKLSEVFNVEPSSTCINVFIKAPQSVRG